MFEDSVRKLSKNTVSCHGWDLGNTRPQQVYFYYDTSILNTQHYQRRRFSVYIANPKLLLYDL